MRNLGPVAEELFKIHHTLTILQSCEECTSSSARKRIADAREVIKDAIKSQMFQDAIRARSEYGNNADYEESP